ncbi:DivIVA domain-containing protein [Bifidobacterium aquikefiri]|uniref:DivIVA domain-containing protein n=1 Tax=Bifidobacterium aquikefiri TaxID=1653207 RepID=UPI0023F2EC38|nr:DivIVA domain-containing protein [Bifidobacterium aquikefiri]
MAKKPEANGNGTNIARVGKHKWGYDSQQVDEFLDNAHKLYESPEPKLTQKDIQDVSFGLLKNGYAVGQVDAALARLERAVVDKQTQWEIAQNGRVAWRGQTEAMYRKFMNHCERQEKERFKPGTSNNPSYDRKQVDRLLDQLFQKLSQELGESSTHVQESGELIDLTPNRVSNVVFTQRKGKKGYDERQVDYFLNYGVQLLSRIESYARVTDYSRAEASEAAQSQNEPSYEPQTSDLGSLAALAEPENPNVQETQVFQPVQQPTPQVTASASPSDRVSQHEVGQSTETIRPLFDENGASIQTPPSRIHGRHRFGEDSTESIDDAAAYANESYSNNRPSSDAAISQNDGRAMFKNLHREEQAVFNQSQAESQATTQTADHGSEDPHQSYSSHNNSMTPGRAGSDFVPQQANAGKVNYPQEQQTRAGANSSNAATEAGLTPQEPAAKQTSAPSTFDFWGRGKSADTNSNMVDNLSFGNQNDSENVRENPASGRSNDDVRINRNGDDKSAGEEAPETLPLSFPVADSRHGTQHQSPVNQGNQGRHTFASGDALGSSLGSDDTPSQPSASSHDTNPSSFSDDLNSIQDTDQYLASLNSMLDSTSFPKVDLDIPDLAFPTTDSMDENNGRKDSTTGEGANDADPIQPSHGTSRDMFNNGGEGSPSQNK